MNSTIIQAARKTAEAGHELSPAIIAELERIADDPKTPDALKLEAEILIGLECMA